MKEFYKRGKRLFVAFLSALLIITQLGIFSPVKAYAQETEGNGYQAAEVKATKAATKADGTTVLTFTSDIHNQSNNTAANRLGDWLNTVRSQFGEIDSMNFCGDMGSASGSGSSWWGYVQSVMDVVDSKGIPGVYTTGNHEFYNGSFTPTANAQARKYVVGDVGREGDNFVTYCLGTDNWSNSQDNITTGQVDKLKTFLNSRGTDKPIIVLVHFPLHTCSGGSSGWGGGRTTQNADLVIDALNAGAAKGQKIILLWGHNHTMSDPLYDQVFVPNDQIEYKSGSKKTIGFYYGAAGCMSDSEYGSGSAYVKGKGLVLTIDNEDKITMTYLNANGSDVTEGGAFKEDGSVTPYNPGDQDDPTPQNVVPESGKKYVILASDGYALTSEGEEVGYSNAGSGTQRYNYKGLTGKQYTPGEDVIPDDLLWNFISTGTKADNGYYIQSNDGKYYLVGEYVSNSTGGYDGTLKLSETEKDEWILTGSSSGSTVNGNLLKSTNASQSDAGDKFLAHGNMSSTSSSGNTNIFSLRSETNATVSSFYEYNDNGTYAGDSGTPVVPTGDTVNITPTTDNPEESISIKVGDTLSINVTNGSSSNAYDFTAAVANSSIAQIQGNSSANIAAGGKATFTIKGLAKGTTDITIQNSNTYGSQYTRKGVVHVTVTDGGSTPVDPPTGDTVNITPTTDNPEESISIKVGETLDINVTNGSTNSAYDFTATVANSSIAQIQGSSTINIGTGASGKFTVKGLAKGTTDITIQNTNQYGSQYVRKGIVHVTVTDGGSTPVDPPTPVGENNYKLTDQFTSGKTYLIVDRNSTGSGHALSNPGGTSTGASLGTANVTVQSGDVDGDGKSDTYISTESTNVVWTATFNNAASTTEQSKFNITNGSDYLEGYQGNVGIFNTQNYPDRGWSYNSNQLQHTGGQNTYTVYYSNGFTGTYNSVSDKVYLYEKVDYVEPHEHTWDDGVVTTPATCTEAGVKTFTCTGCGETRTEAIEALGHDWEETVKEATCTEAGEKTTTCKRCGETTTEEIPVLGHEYGEWQIHKEATCAEAGTQYRVCKNCGGIESEQIPALGHEYQEVEGTAKAATCTEAGKEADQKCTRCGDVIDGKELPALGHEWSEWETRIEPTETAKGLKVRHCSRCLTLETEDIPMITPSKPDVTPTPTPTPDSKDEPKKEESKSTVPTKIPAEISPTNPVSAAAVDKQILNAKTDGDPKGSVFNLLQAKGVAKGKTSVKVSWKKVTGAKKYIVYGNKCGTKYRFKKIKEVTGTSFTQKKLKKGTYYKYLIVAVSGNKALATSKGIHVATKGGKVGNSKSVTTKAKKNKVTLKKGKTFKLGAKAIAESKKLKVKKHRAIAYESANKKVATISKKGVIKGVKKGTCYVYAYAQNGVSKKIKVTVK